MRLVSEHMFFIIEIVRTWRSSKNKGG